MRSVSGRLSAGQFVPFAAGAAVFAFACGSSSVAAVASTGRPLRWAVLLALLGTSAAWALERRAERPAAALLVIVAAAVFVAVALLSVAWSVAPRTTAGRALSIGVLFATALLIAFAASGRRAAIERVLAGLVAGAAAVALGGLVVLAVAHRTAVSPATNDLPARFQGLGENPNTAALLFALALPPAFGFALRGRSRPAAAGFGWAAAVLFAGSIAASGSRGAVIAAAAGCLVVAAMVSRRSASRAVAIVTVLVVAGACAAIQTLPSPNRSATPAVAPTAASPPAAKPGYVDAEVNFPLSGELGIPPPGASEQRTILTSSGRREAWGGAIRQAEQRPLTGYGFGTEGRVFIDRWSVFVGGLPENSYIGLALQLGVAGLVALGALVAALLAAGLRARGRDGADLAAAAAGVLTAGLVLGLVQSYLYSVGNVGTTTLWIAAFLLPAAAAVRDA